MRFRPFCLAVALASAATIGLELTLTRIFSVTLYYHFAFMVISVAMLGLSVAGVVLYLAPRLFEERRAPVQAAVFMVLFALLALLTLKVAIDNPVTLAAWRENLGRLAALYVATGATMLCSGFAISLAIASARERIGKVYAFDLVGAAVGCAAVIPAVASLTGPGAVLFCAALGAASAALFAFSAEKSRLSTRTGLLSVASLLTVGILALSLGEGSAGRFGRARNPSKFLGDRPVEFEKWNSFSQITVAPAGAADHKWIFIDADAATRIWSGSIKATGWQAPRRYGEVRVASLAYAIRSSGTALIIGPGGGTDIISALHHGVPRVVGVEVNPIIVNDVVLGRYAAFAGDLYREPRVQVVVDEGRSYIRRSGEPYQSIQATLVDTWAASSSGAFTLSENNIYTVEAFEEFFAHLAPGGVVTVTRWYDADRPKEFLRLVALARAALEQRGVAPTRVQEHFVLAADKERRGTLLVSRDPFSSDDLARLAAKVREGDLMPAVCPRGEDRGEPTPRIRCWRVTCARPTVRLSWPGSPSTPAPRPTTGRSFSTTCAAQTCCRSWSVSAPSSSTTWVSPSCSCSCWLEPCSRCCWCCSPSSFSSGGRSGRIVVSSCACSATSSAWDSDSFWWRSASCRPSCCFSAIPSTRLPWCWPACSSRLESAVPFPPRSASASALAAWPGG